MQNNTSQIDLYNWRMLYSITKKIEEINAWKYLKEGEIIAVNDPFTAKNYYCSFAIHNDYKMLKVMLDEESVLNFIDLLSIDLTDESFGINEKAKVIDQNLLCLVFVDEFELGNLEKVFMKYGVYNEKREKYPSFRKLTFAKREDMLNEIEDVQLLIRLYGEILKAISDIKNKNKFCDLTIDSKMLFWNYNENGWRSEYLFVEKLEHSLQEYNYKNEFLTKRIDGLKVNEDSYYEIVRLYLPIPKWYEQLNGMYYPMYIIMVDLISGEKVWQEIYLRNGNDEFLAKNIVEDFAQAILNIGSKPKAIMLCDELLIRILNGFCNKTHLNLFANSKGILNMRLANWNEMLWPKNEDENDVAASLNELWQEYSLKNDNSFEIKKDDSLDKKIINSKKNNILAIEDYLHNK